MSWVGSASGSFSSRYRSTRCARVLSGKLGRSSHPATIVSKVRPPSVTPARRRALTCDFASLSTFGASEASHAPTDASTSGVHVASAAASLVANPMRRGVPPSMAMVTATSPSAFASQAASCSGAGSLATGASCAAAEVTAAICCSMPASSATRGIRVLNSRRAKMSRTPWASIGFTSRSVIVTGSSTSRSRRLSVRLRRTSSRCSRRLPPTTPPILSAFSSSASRVPN